MALSADELTIATSSGNVVQVWDAATGDLRQTVSYGPAASDAILNVDLCGDGGLVAALYDQVLCVWAVETGRQLIVGELAARCAVSSVARCKFAGGGLAIGVTLLRGVQAWNPLTGAQLLKRASIWLAISPDGSQAASSKGTRQRVRRWLRSGLRRHQDRDCHDRGTGAVGRAGIQPGRARTGRAFGGGYGHAFTTNRVMGWAPRSRRSRIPLRAFAPGTGRSAPTIQATTITGNYAAQIWDVASGRVDRRHPSPSAGQAGRRRQSRLHPRRPTARNGLRQRCAALGSRTRLLDE